jgi:ParB-like chromosome segregation protein Spo0J
MAGNQPTKKRMTASHEDIDPRELLFAPRNQTALFWNARQKLDPDEMVELKESIRDDGLLEELVVRRLPDRTTQVVCGERRLRSILALIAEEASCYDLLEGEVFPAFKMYDTLRCKVLYNCSDKQASRLSIAENLKRKNLSEWELMEYCRELCMRRSSDGSQAYGRKDVCDIINRSPTWVSQTMKLYELPEDVKGMLVDETLPRTVALSLLKINQPKVARVLRMALTVAEGDVQEGRARVGREVENLEQRLQEAELSLAGTEVAGSPKEQKEARQAKGMTDRKLSDARNRQSTAQSRQPRLTGDAISRATDKIEGARKGKSNGMSQKAVRTTVQGLSELLVKDDETWVSEVVREGQSYDARDVRLIALGFQMVLGEITERDVLFVLADFYASENRPGWKKPPSAA